MKTNCIRQNGNGLRSHLVLAASLCALLASGIGCIDDYNPFVDTSNAGIYVVSQTVADGDTVSIFSAETLQVQILLKEHIDRLVVTASENRTWAGDTQVTHDQFATEPLSFVVSFYDTGRQWVSLTTHGGGSMMSADTFWLHAVSPLHQDTVTGAYSTPLQLSTTPVGDKDARYVWSFGAGEDIESDSATTMASVSTSSPSSMGELWVTDGTHRSPSVPFTFFLGDTTPPTIHCINLGHDGGDTVYPGNPRFVFKVAVEDDGGRPVDSVSCNGEPFDETRVNGNGYYRFLTGLTDNDVDNPFVAFVHAIDDIDSFRNEASRTFYIVYSDTLPAGPDVGLNLSFPGEEVTVTGSRSVQLIGTIETNVPETLQVVVEVETTDSLHTDTVTLNSSALPWYRTVTLTEGTNPLSLRVLDTTLNDTHQVLERTLAYVPGLVDTTPPVILDVFVYDRRATGGSAIVYKSLVTVRVNAGDAAGNIGSVLFNGIPWVRTNQSWYYSDTLRIEHSLEGTDILIQIEDESGNVAEKTVTAYFNRYPVFERKPSPAYLWVDSTYRSVVTAIDADGDEVVFSKHRGPETLEVTPTGDITWTPGRESIGSHTVRLRATDGYQSVYYSYNLYVSDSGQPAAPVVFETLEEDFPVSLQADRDTLELTLRVRPGTGIAPYYYSARLANSGGILLQEERDSVLHWTPTMSDTGYRQLLVSVRDNISSSDTIYPRIFVVPSNRPCSLSVSYNSSTTATGAVDLNARRGADTLLFRISDPDPSEVERHAVTVYQARTHVTSSIDSMVSDSLRVIVNPWVFDGSDTVIVTVRDVAGNADTLIQTIYYGFPPEEPTLLSPSHGATDVGRPLTLSWQGSDPDDDAFVYELYLGTAPNSMTLRTTTDTTEQEISGLNSGTSYYWQVRARDWKGEARSPTFTFTTQ